MGAEWALSEDALLQISVWSSGSSVVGGTDRRAVEKPKEREKVEVSECVLWKETGPRGTGHPRCCSCRRTRSLTCGVEGWEGFWVSGRGSG